MDLDTKYKVFIVDAEKRASVNSTRRCAATGSPVCFCEEFLLQDAEGPCEYGAYSKTARTEEELERYLVGPDFKDGARKKT